MSDIYNKKVVQTNLNYRF